MRALWTRGLILALAVTAAGCSDDRAADAVSPPTAEPGTLVVKVVSPFEDDGAISFDLAGPDITNVRAPEGVRLYATQRTSGVGVAVVGGGLTEAVALFDVPDVGRASEYQVLGRQAADTDNDVRPDVSGYRFTVTRLQ